MNSYELGLRGHDIANDFSEMCLLADQHKIHKLQFALAKTMSEVDFGTIGYDENLAEDILKKLSEHQLEVSVLGCYINPVHGDANVLDSQLNMFKNFIRYAKKFNAGGIGTETGMVRDSSYTHSEENYQTLLKNMIPLIRYAEEMNVNVYIEPVSAFTINSPKKMKRMIDDVASKNLNVILDVSNIMTQENFSEQRILIDEAFDEFADRIKVIHLKDFEIEDGKRRTVMLGTGQLDVPYLFEKIKQMGNTPDIILDETLLENYQASCNRLKEILSE